MAARLKPRHQEDIRLKIQGSQLLNLLQNHALDNKDLSDSRIKCAQILLAKILPDLKAIDYKLDGDPITGITLQIVNGT